MEEKQLSYVERVARLVLVLGILFLVGKVCAYFSSVLSYIVAAMVVAVIARPLKHLLKKVKIKGKSAPEWVLALVAIFVIIGIAIGVLAILAPVLSQVITEFSMMDTDATLDSVSKYFDKINRLLIDAFEFAPTFRLENELMDYLRSILSVNIFGNLLATLASSIASVAIGLFSVVFIAFFLIKDDNLVGNIITSVMPDRHEHQTLAALEDVDHLLSRYFLGLIIEMACVGFIDFIGLWAGARLNVETALGIGFMAGMLNIIPYAGPLIGGIIGSALAIVVKVCSPAGLDFNLWVFVLILVCVFMAAQLVDNFFLQPVIYSASIKASPLEIFIVMLMAGTIGGIVGMVVAIPAYTVVRVIAARFFPNVKFIKRLLQE